MRNGIPFVMVLVMACAAGLLSAAVPECERVPVTDPAELVSLHLPPGTTGVFRRVGRSDALSEASTPDEYGTQDASYTPIMGRAFLPSSNDFKPLAVPFNSLACENAATSTIAYAQLELPDGASLLNMRVWAWDEFAADDLWFAMIEDCQDDFAASAITETILASGWATTGSGGNQSTAFGIQGGPVTIDNASCVYRMFVMMGQTTCHGGYIALQKVRAEWKRQLSPAPATATFSDVPVGAFAYQHIEALAASGITAGCGGGNFCPDGYLTRAQMAVFLAKALGLHWTISNH